MGFLRRLTSLEDKREPLAVALVGGSAEERRRLESAYLSNPKSRVIFSGGAENLGQLARSGKAELIEIFAPLEQRAALASLCLEAGVNVSTDMPPAAEPGQISVLQSRAGQRGLVFRVRNECLYYEPYRKAAEIIADEKIGYHTMLRMVVKRKQSPVPEQERGQWLLANESGYLALAEYLSGRVEKVFMLGGQTRSRPGSMLVGLKFQKPHRFGYLLVDFAPELKIRTFNEPVFRQVWATGTAGVVMVNRGEGQLWRAPVLWLRAKDYSRSWELLQDDWNSVYGAMVEESFAVLRQGRPLISGLGLAGSGLRYALHAGMSLTQGRELLV